MRNLGFVQHLAARNTKESWAEMPDYGRLRAGLQSDGCEEVICPKPRRVAIVTSSTPESFKPVRQQRRSLPPVESECEAGCEILEILLSKNAYGDSSNFGGSPPYFCGSPPSRAGNPLVHDVEFVHQRLPPSPAVPTQPKSFKGPSSQPCPSVRVEGFDCSGQDSCRGVPAVA